MSDTPPPPDPSEDSGRDAAAEHDADEPPAQLSAVPFVVAFVLFVVVAAWAFLNLREDPGRLVRPDGIQIVADDRLRILVDGPFEDDYAEITEVGYAIGDDRIFVEAVIDEHGCPDGTDCGAPTEQLIVELVLPEPIGDRRVGPGTGRTLADCDRAVPVPTCR